MLPAISVNKGCHSHQAITLQPPLKVSPEGTWGWKQDAHHQAINCSHSPAGHPEETQGRKTQQAGPRWLRPHMRGMISMSPAFCIFLYLEVLPWCLSDEESACQGRRCGLILEWTRSPGEGNSNPVQYSCLENPHGQKGLVGYNPWGHKRVGHDLVTKQQQKVHGKVLNSLTWNVWFSLINSNLWYSDYLFFFCCCCYLFVLAIKLLLYWLLASLFRADP